MDSLLLQCTVRPKPYLPVFCDIFKLVDCKLVHIHHSSSASSSLVSELVEKAEEPQQPMPEVKEGKAVQMEESRNPVTEVRKSVGDTEPLCRNFLIQLHRFLQCFQPLMVFPQHRKFRTFRHIIRNDCLLLCLEGSDIDVVVSYSGDLKEDAFFNTLHEGGLKIAGIINLRLSIAEYSFLYPCTALAV